MKIKITAELPVPENVRPAVGSIQEVVELAPMPNGKKFYMIMSGITKIGVAEEECEVVE